MYYPVENILRKIFLAMFINCLTLCMVYAQDNTNILEIKLKTATDKEKFIIYNKLVNIYSTYNSEKALKYTNEAYNLANKLDDKVKMFAFIHNMGKIYFDNGDYKKSMELFKRSLSLSISFKNKEAEVSSLLGLSAVYHEICDYEMAMIYLQKSLEISRIIKYKKGIINSVTNIAVTNFQLKNYSNALKYFQEALSLCKDSNAYATYLNYIGCIYKEMGEGEKSLGYFNKSLFMFEKLKDKNGMENILTNIGVSYFKNKNYTKALGYFYQALYMHKKKNNKKGIASSYSNIGDVYIEFKQYNKALELINESFKIAYSIGAKEIIKENYHSFYKIFSALNKHSKALHYYEQFIALKDSIIDDEKQSQIANLQTKFEIEKKDLEINEKQTKIEKQNILLTAYLLATITILLIFVIILLYVRVKYIKRKNVMQQELSKSILKALRQQMNPHFIFNSLSSIEYYISKNDRIKSNEYLSMFANLMRLTLDNSQYDTITIQQEIEALNLYLELESIRFQGKLNFEINIDENIDTSYYKIPPLIIQPYVENAIWHGIMHKKTSGKVEINLTLNDDIVIYTIQDDGVGREMAMKIKQNEIYARKSVGTKITGERLHLINSLYKNKLHIEYFDLKDEQGNPTGTKVEIHIPIIT